MKQQRLEEEEFEAWRLAAACRLQRVPIPRDGNCFFRCAERYLTEHGSSRKVTAAHLREAVASELSSALEHGTHTSIVDNLLAEAMSSSTSSNGTTARFHTLRQEYTRLPCVARPLIAIRRPTVIHHTARLSDCCSSRCAHPVHLSTRLREALRALLEGGGSLSSPDARKVHPIT